MEFSFVTAGLIFSAYILIDGMYAFYTQSIVKKRAAVSATTGALMHFLIAFGVLNYVQNFWYVIPLALGSWLGTYLVVKYDRGSNIIH
jgi:hypothetical protein